MIPNINNNYPLTWNIKRRVDEWNIEINAVENWRLNCTEQNIECRERMRQNYLNDGGNRRKTTIGPERIIQNHSSKSLSTIP